MLFILGNAFVVYRVTYSIKDTKTNSRFYTIDKSFTEQILRIFFLVTGKLIGLVLQSKAI